jgi:hypothetical protein
MEHRRPVFIFAAAPGGKGENTSVIRPFRAKIGP